MVGSETDRCTICGAEGGDLTYGEQWDPRHEECRRNELRLKWRGELDLLPPAEIIIPREAVKRKSEAFAVEMHGFVPIESAWQMMRDAIDDTIGIVRRCRICHCTDDAACPGSCGWVEADLCSRCVDRA